MNHSIKLMLALLVWSCSQPSPDRSQLSNEQKRLAEYSLGAMKLADGLEVSLFAHEPMLVNPTNMDIDHKGRIWICEGYNYRLPLNPDKERKSAGDRILILEDTDLDGIADKQTVFYQGNDVNAALGISVLGNKVFVSKSPNILVFTDEDGDDKADHKEVLFTGMDASDHDHGIHAVIFGPDGKLYFNAGNEIHQMTYLDGTPVVDMAGNEVNDSGNPYRQGMAFRCNFDGSELETIGWNFRNPYELSVDSYGNIWQSDNDDDGNRGTRINLVMEYGNYGYTDEMTGAGWRIKRTGMADEIPFRHWHLNDPGVVPNLLQLYAGSPTGILFYEGDLLPEKYMNGMIHSEAGTNVIRSYPVEKSGYGYKSKIEQIMKATDDPWFRPSDVCIAPDGSLFVSDWYDPGVGGHLVGDQQKGRIFRIAPTGINYRVPKQDFTTIPGLIEALKSPNQAIRYLAWTGLNARSDAQSALLELFREDNPVFSARALWLLAQLDAQEAYELGKNSVNEDLQITAIKIARQKFDDDLVMHLQNFSSHPSPLAQKELALVLRFEEGPEADELWADLALKYQGDRWFLEALGIGSDLNADARLNTWLRKVGDDWNKGFNKDIVWRVRSPGTLPLLSQLILEAENVEESHRYFRAFDFHQSDMKNQAIEALLSGTVHNQKEYLELAFKHLDASFVINSPSLKQQLLSVTEGYRGTEDFLLIIQRYQLTEYNQELLSMVLAQPDQSDGVNAARLLLQYQLDLLGDVLHGHDQIQISAVLTALGKIGSQQSLANLEDYMFDSSHPLPLRQKAASSHARGWSGENRMLELLSEHQIPEELLLSVAESMSASFRAGIRIEAAKYLDRPQEQDGSSMPSIAALVARQGDPKAGAPVFENLCQSCHIIDGEGTDFGPGLSEIGSKLSSEALYASILKPEAGISFGYEGYLITLVDGTKITGMIQSRTASAITIKQIGGIITVFTSDQVKSIEQLDTSLMTPNLHRVMNQKELVDLVSYLEQLKKPT